MSLGELTVRVASETRALRPAVIEHLGLALGNDVAKEGLLLSRPAVDGGVGSAAWVLYESGDIVLRRSRDEADVIAAACVHLDLLRHAVATDLLPLRLRTIVLPDGSAVLAAPGPIHGLAGLDRRLAKRGAIVVPSTVAIVDATTCEVVLPEQSIEPAVPSGRFPIRSILLRDQHEPVLDGADVLLALARLLIRDPLRALQPALDYMVVLAAQGVVSLAAPEEIIRIVGDLGASSSA